jgi:hypothetical protein
MSHSMTNPLPIDKSQIDQLYAASILTEEAYHAALERWRAQQIAAGDRCIAAHTITDSQLATGDNSRNIQATTYVERQERRGDEFTQINIDQIVYTLTNQLPTRELSAEQIATITTAYLTLLLDRYQFLDFKGMGVTDRVALQLPLLEMFIPLRARREMPDGETAVRRLRLAGRPVTEEEALEMGARLGEPVDVLAILREQDGLIVLGDPGAGKTTLLKYLALLLALGQGETIGLSGYLPVLIPLSAYANALAAGDVALQDFLGDYYTGLGIPLPVRDLLDAFLADGRTLLLMDGLDEVQEATQRTTLVNRFEAFFAAHRPAGNKFVLSSRIVGYREIRPSARGLVECTLVDFDDDDIAAFVTRWSRAVERAVQGDNPTAQQQAQREGDELLAAIARNPGVRQLAANPLLLTILALMKRQGVGLPERRAQLYETYVRTLLRTWNLARQLDGRPSREVNDVETLRVLAPLALWMHESSPGVGLVKREKVRRKLIEIYEQRAAPDPEAATNRFLEDVHKYASLLLERGPGEYGFIHLTFQEYLAGVAVVQQGQRGAEPIVRMLAAHLGEESWREVTLLAVGHLGLIQQRDEVASDVITQLLECTDGPTGAAIVLVGEAVRDVQPDGVTAACKAQTIARLNATMIDPALPTRVRCDAGLIASDLGSLPPDLDALVHVPAQALLGYDFRIGKYPVTNTQYQRFMEEGGYANERWWSAEGLKYKQRDEWTEPRYWRSDRFGHATQPVVGISWYEAEAYCKWLTNRGRAAGFVGNGEAVRLPTQAEWMAAVRHGRPGPTDDAHDYPWRGAFVESHANTKESGLKQTSPVHMYPLGVTAGGVWDMAGNVWEWTSDLRGASSAWQKGGSWASSTDRAKASASAADDFDRRGRDNDDGFRVVVVPISR